MESSKSRFLLLGLVVIGLGTVLGTALWLRLGPYPQVAMMGGDARDGLQLYGSVPDFSLTERSGEAVGLKNLRGKVWVADFMYTTCTDTCPLQTASLARLQEQFADAAEFQLVSFTVDPEHDTPEVLSRYAEKYRADARRWYFLTGQRHRVIRLIRDGFYLSVATLPTETDASGMIPHSPRFVLVDREARIRGYYDSREIEAISRLKSDLETLLKG
jgi:cytochrome oxidase Cu insertion factor (SCO1/SenC/PrrC family)